MTEAIPQKFGVRGSPWWTLLATALGVIMVALDGTVVAIANPYIADDLKASLPDLQWVTNAYLLALAVLLIPAGKLGDRYGRRLLFLIGVTGFALTSLAVGLSGTISMVIVFRVLQGVFGAMIMPNTLALLRSAFPADKLNSAVGIWGAATAASTAGGPILAGVLVEKINWESVFYINIPVGVIALVVGLIVLGESRDSNRSRIDLVGLVLLAAGLFLLIFGVIKAQTWGWSDHTTLGFIAGGIIVLLIFILVESRISSPLLPITIFRDRSVSIGAVTVLLNFFALFGVLFFISLYLQNVHDYSAVQAGVRTLPLTVLFVISSPLSGWLTGRFGPRVPITLGLLVVTASMAALFALDTNSSYNILWPPMVGLGLGIGLVVVASTEAIVGNTPVELAGVAGGVQSTFMQLGGVLGSAVLGSVLATRVGGVLAGKLTGAGLPASAARQYGQAKEFVSQGLAPIPDHTPRPVADAITAGAHASFMSGLHVALIVAAVISLAGALLAPLIRRGTIAEEIPEPEPQPQPQQEPVTPEAEIPAPVHRIGGYVRQTGGVPVEHAAVTLIDPGGKQISRHITDGQGRYGLPVPTEGEYVLVVRSRAHQPQATPVRIDGVPLEHDVLLTGSARLAGTVRTRAAALESATIALTDPRGEVVTAHRTAADGTYLIENVPPGDYTMVVSAADLQPVAQPVSVPLTGTVEYDVELAGHGSLGGRVRAAGRVPLPDARLSLLDDSGRVIAAARTDPGGEYRFERLDAGEYTVVATGYPPVTSTVQLSAGGEYEHDIVLQHDS
ncbi:MAG TPA: MFS transporter [Mycobacteriales bacterium]|nr:MFS transporter [Mycobacteriales bacterium]